MKTKRVAFYARVSTDAQTTENQLLQFRAVAERHGWTIVAEFVDHGVSGAKGRQERPQFDALLRGVARREFDMIAAWSVDRLGRSLQDLLSFYWNCNRNVSTFTCISRRWTHRRRWARRCSSSAACSRSSSARSFRNGCGPVLRRARAKGMTLGRPRTDPKVEAKIRKLAGKAWARDGSPGRLGLV